MRRSHLSILSGISLMAVLVVSASTALAAKDEDFYTADNTMRGCRAFLDDINKKNVGLRPFDQGRCVGIVETIRTFPTLCVPINVTVGQAMRVVVKYIDDRPARLHEPFKKLVHEALLEAWPCR
jgi:hypothetical protein